MRIKIPAVRPPCAVYACPPSVPATSSVKEVPLPAALPSSDGNAPVGNVIIS